MEIKKNKRNSIIIPNVLCFKQIWTWNTAQPAQLWAVEISCIRGAYGISRWGLENYEYVYESF